MKRWIALLLCLALLTSMLVACNGGTLDGPGQDTTPSGENGSNGGDDTSTGEDGKQRNEVKLTQYAVVYPAGASEEVRNAAEKLATAMEAVVEDEVKISSDEKIVTNVKDAKEILVGSTLREESRAYYAKTPEFKYNICQSGNKILVAGYSDALTVEAVSQFIKTYVNASDEGVIDFVGYECEWKNGENALILSRNGSTSFVVTGQSQEKDNNRTFRRLVENVKGKIEELTEVADMAEVSYSDTYNADKKEILVGRYSNTQLVDHYGGLELGGYMIRAIKNKLLIAATEDDGYADATAALKDIFAHHTLYGTKNVAIPVGFSQTTEGAEMFRGLPSPAATLRLQKVIRSGNDCQLAIFEKATPDAFNLYCNALKEAGYVEYSRTMFDGSSTLTKNYFATFVGEDRTVDLSFYDYDDILNVSVAPKNGSLTLPATSEPTYTPVDPEQYPIILTQVGTYEFHKSDAAACYIIRIADGSFIIYDMSYSSYKVDGRDYYVAEEIYKILKKQAPDPENVVISAIFLSHPHLDHMGGFIQFSELYAADTSIKLKQVVYNFPDLTVAPNSEGKNNTENHHIKSTNLAIKRFGPSLEVVKPHSGNILHYAGVRFNVLYTQEDLMYLFDNLDGLGNAMSMVVQMITSDGTKTILGGDYWADKSEQKVLYRYGAFLESYVSALFHHGIGGGADADGNIYKRGIKAKIALMPLTWAKMGATDSTEVLNFADSAWNKYFTAGKTEGTDGRPGTGGFEEGKLHTTPNVNGVVGWFLADDGIQIVIYKDGKVDVATYETRADYLNS